MGFILTNEFYCTQCGEKGIPVARRTGSERKAGHLKKLYCLKCQAETNHVECKPYSHYTHEDFLLEFNNNNFDKKGQRRQKYGSLRDQLNKEGRL